MASVLEDLNSAARLREVITAVASDVVEANAPQPRYATVVSVDHVNSKATLQYPNEAGTFTVPTTAVAPDAAGGVVRVGGAQGARYVDEIVSGAVRARTGLVVQGSLIYSVAGTPSIGLGTTWNSAYAGLYLNGSNYVIMTDGTNTFVSAPAAGGSLNLRPGNNDGHSLTLNSNGAHTLVGDLSFSGHVKNPGYYHYSSAYLFDSDSGIYQTGDGTFDTRVNGVTIMTTAPNGVWMNQRNLYLYNYNDGNHYIGYHPSPNGPLICGYIGGWLYSAAANNWALEWNNGRDVHVGQQMWAGKVSGPSWNNAAVLSYAGAYSSGIADLSMHSGFTAGMIRLTTANNFLSAVDAGGALTDFYCRTLVQSSSETVKQDIAPLGFSAIERLRQVEMVTYRRPEASLQMPERTIRREEALTRLNDYAARTGRTPRERAIHRCEDHTCAGTHSETDPCSWRKNWAQPSVGFVIEQAEPIIPEITAYGEDGAPMGFDLSSAIGVLMAGLKELDARLMRVERGVT